MTVLEMLREEHANARRLLGALEWQIAEFKIGNQPDYDVFRAVTDYFLAVPDASHHAAEDLMFDKLRERAPQAAAPIRDLRAAHEELSERIRKLADGLRALLAEAEMPRENFVRRAVEFIAAQRQHMDTEEIEFFPAAEQMLTEKDWSELQAEMAKRADPITRAKVLEKFGRLRQSIFAWQDQDEALRPRHVAAAWPRPTEH